MRGKTHGTIGLASAWLLIFLPGFIPSPILPLIAGFFALLPDIEGGETKIKHLGTKNIKPLAVFGTIATGLFKHRGFFHSVFMVLLLLLMGTVLYFYDYIPFIYVLAALVGYLSHIALDALTPAGILLYWPFKKKFRLMPRKIAPKTGGMIDELLFIIGLMGVLFYYLTFWQYWAGDITLIPKI